MTSPAALEKFSKLANFLFGEAYYDIGLRGEFELKMWERDLRAQFSRGIEAPLCALLLAVVCRLGEDPRKAIIWVQEALTRAPFDPQIVNGSCKVLEDLGGFRDARRRIHEYLPTAFAEGVNLKPFMLHAKLLLDFEAAADISERILSREPDTPMDIDFNPIEILGLRDMSLELNVDSDGWAERLACVTDTLHESEAQIYAVAVRHLDDGNGVLHQLFVKKTVTQCVELNFAMASALCNRFDEAGGSVVSFVCRPIEAFTQMRAAKR